MTGDVDEDRARRNAHTFASAPNSSLLRAMLELSDSPGRVSNAVTITSHTHASHHLHILLVCNVRVGAKCQSIMCPNHVIAMKV